MRPSTDALDPALAAILAKARSEIGKTSLSTEPRPDGTYQEVERLRDFNNLNLLAKMVREVMDYVGWEDMPYLKLPKIRGGKIEIVATEPHPLYARARDWFGERLEEIRKNPPHVKRELPRFRFRDGHAYDVEVVDYHKG